MPNAKDNSARKFDFEVQGSVRDLGELQFNVLQSVAEKRYGDAVKVLHAYRQMKSTYVHYLKKTDPLFKRAEELISAIEAKKTFPNLQNLAQNKQEEIHQKAMENWEDLKVVVRRLRTVERDMAVADARSSIWVMKAVLFSFVVIMTVFVVTESFRSFGKSFPVFIEETTKLISDSFNSLF